MPRRPYPSPAGEGRMSAHEVRAYMRRHRLTEPLPTLGDMAAAGQHVAVLCPDRHCRRSATLLIGALAAEHGAATPYVWVAERLRCGECGRRAIVSPIWRDPIAEYE